MSVEYGLLLPHFGLYAGREGLVEGAKNAEELGFDSLWVRDHLIFQPHGEMEDPDRTFYDALTTLSVVGAVTERITLGTGSLIPFRHPLHTALTVSTMTHLVGQRLIIGMGAGTFDHEFEAIGLGDANRVDLVRANADVMRRVWTDDDVAYADDAFEFSDVTIEPKPLGGPPPIWYCGQTPASARRAAEYADGWMPGRISLKTLEARVSMLEDLSASAGRPRPTVGVIPPTSVHTDRAEALASVNIDGLLAWANKARFSIKPPSGVFESVEDLEGQLIAGTPDDVVRECKKLESVGAEHIVFDLRFTFDRWLEQIGLIGTDVLPSLQ